MAPFFSILFFLRVVLEEKAHLKSYASENLSAISILCIFYQTCYEPLGIMKEFGLCLFLLKYICDIVFGNEREASQLSAELGDLIDQHHTLFLRCYGASLAGVKIHWLFHLPRMIQKFGALNCFAAERANKKACQLGQHECKNKVANGNNILRRDLHQLLETFDENEFTSTFICNPKEAPEFARALQPYMADVISPSVAMGNSIVCELGRLKDKQLIACRLGGRVVLGKSHSFARAHCIGNRHHQHFAFFQKLENIRANLWGLSSGAQVGLDICNISEVLAILPCRLEQNGAAIRPLLPFKLKDSRIA